MNGVHDLGGMHGFGAVLREENEPVFHAEWERRSFAIVLAMLNARCFNIDEFRRTIERMPPERYLRAPYYARWLYAIEGLLAEKGIIGAGEIDARIEHRRHGREELLPGSLHTGHDAHAEPSRDAPQQSSEGSRAAALRHDPKFKARFRPGDRVIARNLNPQGHTRLPRYVRGHRGVIHRDWGTFVFPDSHAHGAGANPQHCYAVEFGARELWGEAWPSDERVYVDL
jgi:nitrile hydratase beta subunit